MNFLKGAVAEIWSLFVDDPLFALSLAVWTAVGWALASRLSATVAGPVLFGGYAILLLTFTVRQAGRAKK